MLRNGTPKIDGATKMLMPNGGVNVLMLRLVTTIISPPGGPPLFPLTP
jgi:hypothetical protein